MAEHEPYGVKLQTLTVNIRLGAPSGIQIRYLAGRTQTLDSQSVSSCCCVVRSLCDGGRG